MCLRVHACAFLCVKGHTLRSLCIYVHMCGCTVHRQVDTYIRTYIYRVMKCVFCLCVYECYLFVLFIACALWPSGVDSEQ